MTAETLLPLTGCKRRPLCSSAALSWQGRVSWPLFWQSVPRCHFPRKGFTSNAADCLLYKLKSVLAATQTEIRRRLLSLWTQLAETVRDPSPLFQDTCSLMSHMWALRFPFTKELLWVGCILYGTLDATFINKTVLHGDRGLLSL